MRTSTVTRPREYLPLAVFSGLLAFWALILLTTGIV